MTIVSELSQTMRLAAGTLDLRDDGPERAPDEDLPQTPPATSPVLVPLEPLPLAITCLPSSLLLALLGQTVQL